jgi:hypothetical protein
MFACDRALDCCVLSLLEMLDELGIDDIVYCCFR